MNTIKLKLNIAFEGYKAGEIIVLESSKSNIPLDQFWRRRLKDSKKDGCVEEVVEEITSSKPKPVVRNKSDNKTGVN